MGFPVQVTSPNLGIYSLSHHKSQTRSKSPPSPSIAPPRTPHTHNGTTRARACLMPVSLMSHNITAHHSIIGLRRRRNHARARNLFLLANLDGGTYYIDGRRFVSRVRMDWEQRVAGLTSRQFHARYAMSHPAFTKLMNLVLPAKPLKHNELCRELRMSIFLRMACGGAYQDVADLHGVGEQTVYRTFHRVVDAVNSCAALDFDFDLQDDSKMAALAAEFNRGSTGLLNNCVGALDGVHIRIKK